MTVASCVYSFLSNRFDGIHCFFQVELNRKYRMHDILTQKNMSTSTYINARTVFMRCQLPKGRYVILPTTFKPQTMGEYMIRVFTDVESGCRYVVQTPGDRRSQTREILERLRLRVCCCLPQPGEGVREQKKNGCVCVICSQKALQTTLVTRTNKRLRLMDIKMFITWM